MRRRRLSSSHDMGNSQTQKPIWHRYRPLDLEAEQPFDP